MFSQHMNGFSQGNLASSHCSESTIQHLQYLVFVHKQEANLALKGEGRCSCRCSECVHASTPVLIHLHFTGSLSYTHLNSIKSNQHKLVAISN